LALQNAHLIDHIAATHLIYQHFTPIAIKYWSTISENQLTQHNSTSNFAHFTRLLHAPHSYTHSPTYPDWSKIPKSFIKY